MAESKEMIINQVIAEMQTYADVATLRALDNILRNVLYPYAIEKMCTELCTGMDDNLCIIKIFASNKKLEGCKDSTIEQYVRCSKTFLEDINKNYKDITKEDVKLYLAKYSMKHSQNSVCNLKKYLSTFFQWLNDEQYINCNPVRSIKGIKQKEVENKFLSIEEELAVRDVASKKSVRDMAIVDVLLSTGLRVSEIRNLNRNSVDFVDGSITLMGAKNDKYRTVYLDARAKKHLREYLATRKDDNESLFLNKKRQRMGENTFENIVKGICREAGIQKTCTVHVFRKTFATRLADRGCPLEVIQELLGHADPGTTSKHYIAKSKTRIKRACEMYLLAA